MRVGGHEINLDVLKATPCGWHKYKLFESWLIIPGSSWRHWNGRDSDCNLDTVYVSISASRTCLLTRIAWGSTKSPGHTRPQLSRHLWMWDTCILHFWSSQRDSNVQASLETIHVYSHHDVFLHWAVDRAAYTVRGRKRTHVFQWAALASKVQVGVEAGIRNYCPPSQWET